MLHTNLYFTENFLASGGGGRNLLYLEYKLNTCSQHHQNCGTTYHYTKPYQCTLIIFPYSYITLCLRCITFIICASNCQLPDIRLDCESKFNYIAEELTSNFKRKSAYNCSSKLHIYVALIESHIYY